LAILIAPRRSLRKKFPKTLSIRISCGRDLWADDGDGAVFAIEDFMGP